MPVEKYRSIDEMPPPWTDPDDPANLERVAAMMSLWFRLNPRPEPGVRKYGSFEEASRNEVDAYRRGSDPTR